MEKLLQHSTRRQLVLNTTQTVLLMHVLLSKEELDFEISGRNSLRLSQDHIFPCTGFLLNPE